MECCIRLAIGMYRCSLCNGMGGTRVDREGWVYSDIQKIGTAIPIPTTPLTFAMMR